MQLRWHPIEHSLPHSGLSAIAVGLYCLVVNCNAYANLVVEIIAIN